MSSPVIPARSDFIYVASTNRFVAQLNAFIYASKPVSIASLESWLAALWWLIALRGLRRGEAAALDRDDLDSESRELTITRQLIALPGELYCGPPKSRASIRTIAPDEAGTRRLVDQALRQTVELLRHQFTDQRRSDARTRAGPGWQQGRPMFTYADGRPIRPEYLTHRFRTLIKELDLPPIRLHDLRHGAATIALASHADLKVIQQMLGHSSIVTTADTYTSVLPETAHRAAQATADMVMKAAHTIPGAGRQVPEHFRPATGLTRRPWLGHKAEPQIGAHRRQAEIVGLEHRLIQARGDEVGECLPGDHLAEAPAPLADPGAHVMHIARPRVAVGQAAGRGGGNHPHPRDDHVGGLDSVAKRKLRRYPFLVPPIAERFGQQPGELPVIGGSRRTQRVAGLIRRGGRQIAQLRQSHEKLWLAHLPVPWSGR